MPLPPACRPRSVIRVNRRCEPHPTCNEEGHGRGHFAMQKDLVGAEAGARRIHGQSPVGPCGSAAASVRPSVVTALTFAQAVQRDLLHVFILWLRCITLFGPVRVGGRRRWPVAMGCWRRSIWDREFCFLTQDTNLNIGIHDMADRVTGVRSSRAVPGRMGVAE